MGHNTSLTCLLNDLPLAFIMQLKNCHREVCHKGESMEFNIIKKIKSAIRLFKKSNEIDAQKLNDFQLMILHKKMKKKEQSRAMNRKSF